MKNRKNAFWLSTLTVVVFTITDAFLNLLLPYWLKKESNIIPTRPGFFSEPGNLIGLLLFLLLLLIVLSSVGAYWLYRFFGEKYYGARGAWRWAAFGFLFALFLKIPEWITPQGWWIIRGVLQFSGLFAAFFFARWLVPFPLNSTTDLVEPSE